MTELHLAASRRHAMQRSRCVLVCGDGGQRRYVETDDPMAAMYVIGSAFIFAEQTARPGFREMIDTINWAELR